MNAVFFYPNELMPATLRMLLRTAGLPSWKVLPVLPTVAGSRHQAPPFEVVRLVGEGTSLCYLKAVLQEFDVWAGDP